jgi:hypothetical protein
MVTAVAVAAVAAAVVVEASEINNCWNFSIKLG